MTGQPRLLKWELFMQVMTCVSIYETITVAICFPIDPSTHRWAVLWAVLEIHLYVRWLLDELLHAAAFSKPAADSQTDLEHHPIDKRLLHKACLIFVMFVLCFIGLSSVNFQ